MEYWFPGLFCGIGLGISLGAFAILRRGRKSQRARDRRASSNRVRTIFLAVVLIFGICYGMVREHAAPRLATGDLLGRVGQVRGQVTAVYKNTTSTTVYLAVSQVAYPTNTVHVSLRVRWRGTAADQGLVPGEIVVVQGTLGFPAPSGSGKPPMPLQPPTYTLSGRLLGMEQSHTAFLVQLRDTWLALCAPQTAVSTAHQKLAASMVFGSSDLSPSLQNAFLSAGLLHVLAASGANILLLEMTLEHSIRPLWRLTRLPFWLWSLFVVALIWMFAGMCAFAPSIVRAAIMATYRFIGLAVGRKAVMSTSLAMAGAVIVLVQPDSMLSPSAWLSFVATGAIAQMLLFPRRQGRQRFQAAESQSTLTKLQRVMTRWFWRGFHSVWSTLRTTMSVELWVAPLVLVLFSQVTPYSMVANVLCEPLIALVLPLSLVWMTLTLLLHWLPWIQGLVTLFGLVEDHLLLAVEQLVQWIAAWPGSLWTISGTPSWVIVPYYLLLTILMKYIGTWSKYRYRQRVSL